MISRIRMSRVLMNVGNIFNTPSSRNTHAGIETIHEDKECVEVQISVPWGHLSGKWWGPKNVRPIVGFHGWQDNAGTFDTLAPLLPKHIGLLSIDLPGHGTSSRLPDGVCYNTIDSLLVFNLIMKEYHWEKISILAHSMGSLLGFLYTGLHPEKVDMLIGLDALKPHVRPTESIPDRLRKQLAGFHIADERNRLKEEPPSYTYEDCVDKLHLGTMKSVDRDKCAHLLNRNIAKSTKYPDKYYFTRDSRLKYSNYVMFYQELSLEIAKRITCPYLFIKANQSSYFEKQKYFHEAVEVLKGNPDFHLHYVDGKHHVHLNEPHKVSGIINEFINKYRSADSIKKELV